MCRRSLPEGGSSNQTPHPRKRRIALGSRSGVCGSNEVAPSQEPEAELDKRDEDMWDALFARSPDVLERLAAEAEQEDRAGLTEELDPDSL